MDPIKNPFSPGAGSPPPELVGRDPVLSEARVLLGRIAARRPEKSLLLTGLRGVGKTVLLNEIERLALAAGYRTISVEASEDKRLGVSLAPFMRKVLFDLDRVAGAGDKVKRALAVLRSFVGSIKVSVDDLNIGLDIESERGTADSGDLEIDLPDLFVAVGEAALERKSAVGVFIDEIQYFNHKELGALIMAMHKVQQRQLPILLLGAGLPILPGLAGESKSYAERLFNFPNIGALAPDDAAKALQDPAQAAGVTFEGDALTEVFRLTRGYPYFVQEWGYQAWNVAKASPITLDTIRHATASVVVRLDQNFFRVRYERLTPSEKNFLRAMAELGSQAHRTGDIADMLGVKVNSLGPVRAKLIKKGMVYSPAHGDMAFTVPLFDEFLMRTVPDFRRP
ncbi:MAG: ATP-binding protein [Methylibium sp.]|uniref:ATP-binding protein n=1 Tax=Methylibium sp. TaxID=2067992 RepID=UPI00185716CA|nr:ATP-binding protein [Methylibium sp.]MBA2721934.1 ATP-binding protein [Methylibium sp.]MBA3589603.1 ATP-binding protein [Methylibium sp.]MBA3625011.1 ATP-binding protein [Methylibium sp.]